MNGSNELIPALRTVRRAKNFLFLVLLVCLLGQMALYLAYKYGAPSIEAPPPTGTRLNQAIDYLVGLSRFVAMGSSILHSIVLLLIVNMVLIGQLAGLRRASVAFIVSVIVLVAVFPWQAILENYDFKIPGALYGWQELRALNRNDEPTILVWTRFVIFPGFATLLLVIGQAISAVGLRQSLKT